MPGAKREPYKHLWRSTDRAQRRPRSRGLHSPTFQLDSTLCVGCIKVFQYRVTISMGHDSSNAGTRRLTDPKRLKLSGKEDECKHLPRSPICFTR